MNLTWYINTQYDFEKFAAETVGEKKQMKGSDACRFVIQLTNASPTWTRKVASVNNLLIFVLAGRDNNTIQPFKYQVKKKCFGYLISVF